MLYVKNELNVKTLNFRKRRLYRSRTSSNSRATTQPLPFPVSRLRVVNFSSAPFHIRLYIYMCMLCQFDC